MELELELDPDREVVRAVDVDEAARLVDAVDDGPDLSVRLLKCRDDAEDIGHRNSQRIRVVVLETRTPYFPRVQKRPERAAEHTFFVHRAIHHSPNHHRPLGLFSPRAIRTSDI